MTQPFHGGASQGDRIAEDHADRRRGPFRRMVLLHGGKPFLKRWALDVGPFGVYLHHLCGPDPGKDLHDHPWAFITWVVRGRYSDLQTEARSAPATAHTAERFPETCHHGTSHEWQRFSVHRMPLTVAHRITTVWPNTWTIVLRGRKSRDWGFFPPSGYISQRDYDYDTRRPVSEHHS